MAMDRIGSINHKNILCLPNGLYSGFDSEGNSVVVSRQEGHGFTITTPTHGKWYECKEYAEEGNLVGVTYEQTD